jgi:hypothetical protein
MKAAPKFKQFLLLLHHSHPHGLIIILAHASSIITPLVASHHQLHLVGTTKLTDSPTHPLAQFSPLVEVHFASPNSNSGYDNSDS